MPLLIPPALALVVILAVAFALMLSNRVRPDVVAIGVALALGLTGLVTPDDVFAGFSTSAVITIIAIFILAQGVQRTGVTRTFGQVLARRVKGGERGMIAAVMGSGATLSLFMNNIAAAAVLLPGAVDAVKRQRLTPSKIMMPLAFGTALGGMATLLTTGNIVVSAALVASNNLGYGLLDFALVGVPVTLAGIAFMLTLGRTLLPSRDPGKLDAANGDSLTASYELFQRLNRVRIPQGSSLADRSISDSGIGKEYGMSVMAVLRDGRTLLAPAPGEVIRAGDTLLLIGRRERAEQLVTRGAIIEADGVGNGALDGEITSDDVSLVEVMVAPRSRAVGQTLKQLRFREKFGANVLALWHGGRSWRTDQATVPLQLGDSMLVHGSREAISLLQGDSDYLVLRPPQAGDAPARTDRAIASVVILAVTLLVAAIGVIPIASAMMLGALVMVLAGCLTMDEAYRAIEWRAVFLIAGMLPVSVAMINTGVADAIGQGIVTALSRFGPVAVGAGLLVVTMALSQVMSGQVTAVVLAPIAISAAAALGSDPRAMAMFVAMGSSLTFITPTAHPVNVFVMGAGGYTASDYPRVGVPLTLLLSVLIVILVALVWRP
jgi:di/tricarboxylate transporter